MEHNKLRIRPNLRRVHKKCSEWLTDYCVPGNAILTVKITSRWKRSLVTGVANRNAAGWAIAALRDCGLLHMFNSAIDSTIASTVLVPSWWHCSHYPVENEHTATWSWRDGVRNEFLGVTEFPMQLWFIVKMISGSVVIIVKLISDLSFAKVAAHSDTGNTIKR